MNVIDRNTTTAVAQEAVRNRVFGAPPWSATTEVGKALARLTPATDPATLEKLATLSPQEQARLNRLTEDLSKSPATAAAEQKLKADRIKRLADTLSLIAALTTDDALNNLLALHGIGYSEARGGAAGGATSIRYRSTAGSRRGCMAHPVGSRTPLLYRVRLSGCSLSADRARHALCSLSAAFVCRGDPADGAVRILYSR